MVLGAPMVIALAAGIAVPVITLGIPIYMGKKVTSVPLEAPAALPLREATKDALGWHPLED